MSRSPPPYLRFWGSGRSWRRLPPQGLIGVLLVATAWPASWLRIEPAGDFAFFPLWLGYILVVDALVELRGKSSLLGRNRAAFALLFVWSVPLWWLFEGINHFTQNWHYLGGEDYSTLEYALIASWHFSIVIPAVLETAQLVASFAPARLMRGPSLRLSASADVWLIAAGAVGLAAVLAFPDIFFPLTWLAVFLVLDPLNHRRGRPSLLAHAARGDWRLAASLSSGALICGFFWEMWNFWAFPMWVYTLPAFDFLRVFEMPLLGYGGYLPFGLEVFAAYHFLAGLAPLPRFEPEEENAHRVSRGRVPSPPPPRALRGPPHL